MTEEIESRDLMGFNSVNKRLRSLSNGWIERYWELVNVIKELERTIEEMDTERERLAMRCDELWKERWDKQTEKDKNRAEILKILNSDIDDQGDDE